LRILRARFSGLSNAREHEHGDDLRRREEVAVIVVGVDGSEESKRAMRWAVTEAQLRQTAVRAVYAFLTPAVSARG
jgi:hypothetical protein